MAGKVYLSEYVLDECDDGWGNCLIAASQNLPSSERHLPSNPERQVGAVGTTAGHFRTTRNFSCITLHFLLLRRHRPAVVEILCASRGESFRANYEGLTRRHTKDLLFNCMWKANKLPVHKTLVTSLWLCMGWERRSMDCPSRPQGRVLSRNFERPVENVKK